MSTSAAIARIACAQHGLFTRAQALEAGLSPGQIRRRLRRGDWLALRPGVYAVAGAPPTWEQSVLAASLATQPGAWASHHTAAALWGFPGVAPESIDMLVPWSRRLRITGVHEHRSTALFSADLAMRRAIPVTTPARTLVDLSASLPVRHLGQILDDSLRRRLMRLELLRRCVARLEGAPGRRPSVIHELLTARLPGYDPLDSDLETSVLRLIAGSGMALPVQQHRVRLKGRTYKVDLAYPDIKLAIELDGWAAHGSRSAFDDDRARANALILAGWTILRFTSRSTDDEILGCVRAARAGLVIPGSHMAAG